MHTFSDSPTREHCRVLISFVVVVQHLLTVTPVVGIVPEHHKFEPRPNAGEVDAIFDVPLEMFLKVCTLNPHPHLSSFHCFVDFVLSPWASLLSRVNAS
jgi:hypothetical protein